jgi:cysteine desulfurase/selenocysteine lyase
MIEKDIKKDFKILSRKINDADLHYLDNAASSQKPDMVIGAINDYYFNHHANVHRAFHTLSEESTEMYEHARKNTGKFIGVDDQSEIIFTNGGTEALNMVAFGYGLDNVRAGDVILLTIAEHHSNLIPWQKVAKKTGAKLEYLYVDEEGELDVSEIRERLGKQDVKIIAITHASNTLGNIFPVKEICKIATDNNVVTVVDGSQAAPHIKVNVKSIGCDFYVFSGHKMLGPTGIGVLWGKKELLNIMEPYGYGGGMIDEVDEQTSTWADLPEKFESGTPNMAGAVGLSAAIDYLNKVGMENVREHEIDLNEYALKELSKIEKVKIIGTKDPSKRTGLISFTVEGIHSHDISSVLNTLGVAVRSGHHCTMPLHTKLGINSSVRASWYLYNFKEDIDKLVEGINKAIKLLL